MVNLVDELCFYRKYHHDTRNVAIHVVCIPMILLSSMYILGNVKVPAEFLPLPKSYHPYFSLTFVAAVFYAQFYTRLDVIYGLPYGAFLLWVSKLFVQWRDTAGAHDVRIAWGIWTFSWIAQFIGHGAFEKRAPALLDSLSQALLLAPFFAVFELSHALGIRKHILDDVDKKVMPEIQRFHAARLGKSKAA